LPVDDPLLERISVTQWLWYAAQLAADDKEQFELMRDMAEYNASFWNPEGVDQVRKAREKTFKISDKDFARQIEETFGRKLSVPEKKEGLALPNTGKVVRRKMREDLDASAYLETELDDVKFVPMEH